jgi:hypothetical protein
MTIVLKFCVPNWYKYNDIRIKSKAKKQGASVIVINRAIAECALIICGSDQTFKKLKNE